VDLTGARCAGGGVIGGGGARGRRGHGKQRGKCRECCEERADRSPGQEQQHDAVEHGGQSARGRAGAAEAET
jgi:hypothetical protein